MASKEIDLDSVRMAALSTQVKLDSCKMKSFLVLHLVISSVFLVYQYGL